jgi:hypothetical protein
MTWRIGGKATNEQERTKRGPSKHEQNWWIPSVLLCLSLKRDSRVVNVLEMEDGWKWSSRTWSISKPLPKYVEPVFSKRNLAGPSFRAVLIWPSQNWLARALERSVMRAASERAVEKLGRWSQ